MQDPYQWERNNAKTMENSDTFELPPLDFRTEEERSRIEVAKEEVRIAKIEKALQTKAEVQAKNCHPSSQHSRMLNHREG